jgi:hypothetical protein
MIMDTRFSTVRETTVIGKICRGEVLKAEDVQTPSYYNLSYTGTEAGLYRYPASPASRVPSYILGLY